MECTCNVLLVIGGMLIGKRIVELHFLSAIMVLMAIGCATLNKNESFDVAKYTLANKGDYRQKGIIPVFTVRRNVSEYSKMSYT